MEKYEIKEDFLGFTELFSTTGISIKQVILKKLNDFGLSMANLRSQGYDGGSDMSSIFYYKSMLLKYINYVLISCYL